MIRDVISFLTILYGSRISLFVGFASMFLAMLLGVSLGLISGYIGGALDSFIMRIADVQISFPAILIVLLISGVARSMLPNVHQEKNGGMGSYFCYRHLKLGSLCANGARFNHGGEK